MLENEMKITAKVLNNIDQLVETKNLNLLSNYEETIITKTLDISEEILYMAIFFNQQEILREIDKMLNYYNTLLLASPDQNTLTNYIPYVPTKTFKPYANINKDNFKFTYIMKDDYSKQVKIGVSKNVSVREATLLSVAPSIRTLSIIPINLEVDLHKKYITKRTRGEWYKLNKDELNELILFFNLLNQYLWKKLIL